ncbi:helix-turn-helix transcriptional regulator [Pectobacterium cacticida]|uniref:AraC family transcriptional regulator n=1 Tax=Pectobacterium cacticida TaxID=69221 RepID=UPI002FEFAF02
MSERKGASDEVHPDSINRRLVPYTGEYTQWQWGQNHRHRKAQLLYSVLGAIHCKTENGVWIVPPQCAVWIPGKTLHAVSGVGNAKCYCFYIQPEGISDLPTDCCTLSVSPLLRELLLKAVQFPSTYTLGGAQERLILTLIDEIVCAPKEELSFPLPKDPRLQQLAATLLSMPSDKTSKSEWAQRIGMSERNMSRRLMNEVGLSFGDWRRQLHIILSLQWLMNGSSVKNVALRLGYESASSFITMFRKAVGESPARYLTQRMKDIVDLPVPAISMSNE